MFKSSFSSPLFTPGISQPFNSLPPSPPYISFYSTPTLKFLRFKLNLLDNSYSGACVHTNMAHLKLTSCVRFCNVQQWNVRAVVLNLSCSGLNFPLLLGILSQLSKVCLHSRLRRADLVSRLKSPSSEISSRLDPSYTPEISSSGLLLTLKNLQICNSFETLQIEKEKCLSIQWLFAHYLWYHCLIK